MTDCIHHSEKKFVFLRGDKVLFTGTPDAVWVFKKPRVVVVSDRKFGFKQITHADANLQLRAYLVMVSEIYPSDAYYGIITQPRVSARPTTVRYSPADIVKARAEIEQIYDACYAPNPPRRASNQACEWCEAKAICTEHRAWIGEIEKARHLPVAQWTDEQMEVFEERRSAALKFIDEVHEQIKRIKEADPDRLPGWRLKPGAEVRSVTDLVQAWSALQGYMSAKEFSEQCDVSIGGLERLLWQKFQDNPALGKLSQNGAKALINNLLSEIIEKKRNRPSLEKE